MSWVTKTIVLRISRLQAQELVLQALAVDRVDRAERLVHQHQRRVGGERAGHADALALAAGELRGVAVAPSRRVEADQLEQLVDAGADALARPSRAAAGRWRCSRRSSGAGTGRSAGSRSRSRAAGRRAGACGRCARRRRMSPLGDVDHAVDHPHRGRLAAARRARRGRRSRRRGPRSSDPRSPARPTRRRSWRRCGTRGRPPAGSDDGPSGWALVRSTVTRGGPGGAATARDQATDRGLGSAPHAGARRRARRPRASSSSGASGSSRPSAVAISQSANQAFLGSSGPCR